MRKWIALVFLAACAHQVTATGVTECYTTFYVIGWYHGCGRGPDWPQPATAIQQTGNARSQIPPETGETCYVEFDDGRQRKDCGATRDECAAKLSAYLQNGGKASECRPE